jgi:hypothetical protein
MIQNQVLGFYLPNFFRLHIGISNPIDNLNKLSDRDFSVFLHEYIHFLQNITTFYGLNNIHVSVEYMKYANNKIRSDNNSKFSIPIIPDDANSYNLKLNRYLLDFTYGDNGDEGTRIKEITNYSILNDTIPINNAPIKTIEYVYVEFKDNTNNDNCFAFGAGCIMESMAYLMETLTCKDYALSPNLPYETATLLAEFIYPEFANNKLNILALCDISLNCSNPGVYFVKVIEEWKRQNKTPSPQDLYNECIRLNPNICQCLNNIANTAKLQMHDYFKDKYFKSINDWIDAVIGSAINLRKRNPSFILDIANGDIRTNSTFCKIFTEIGTPVLTNNSGFIGFYHPNNNNQAGNFFAISQIHKLFYTGTFDGCELKNFNCCSPIIDCRCAKSPWKRCADKNLCPFALFWHHWGLEQYEPIFKKINDTH